MKVKYLQQVKENKILRSFTNEGMTEKEIKGLEDKYNNSKEFVVAFKEYLFLAGKFSNFGFDDIEGIEELQDIFNEEMKINGEKLDRPVFAFDVYDSQYSVIYLDEDKEDPDVYLCCPYHDDDEPLIKSNGFIFSELVNEFVRRVKNNIAF